MVNNRNLISLTGKIAGDIQFSKNKCRFTLVVNDNYFVIEAPGQEQVTVCKALSDSNEVYIIATPRSYVHRRCRQHHVYFEAVTIIPLDRTGEWQTLISALTEELYRNRNGKAANETDGSHGGGGLPEFEYRDCG